MSTPSRGGKRQGAGRTAGTTKPDAKVSISVRIHPDINARLRLAGKRKMGEQIEKGLLMLWASETGLPCDRCGYPSGDDWLDDGETCPKCRLVH